VEDCESRILDKGKILGGGMKTDEGADEKEDSDGVDEETIKKPTPNVIDGNGIDMVTDDPSEPLTSEQTTRDLTSLTNPANETSRPANDTAQPASDDRNLDLPDSTRDHDTTNETGAFDKVKSDFPDTNPGVETDTSRSGFRDDNEDMLDDATSGDSSTQTLQNDQDLPPWLVLTIGYLRSLSGDLAWQSLVNDFVAFEKLQPSRGVSSTFFSLS
jgi:hypothetical protein